MLFVNNPETFGELRYIQIELLTERLATCHPSQIAFIETRLTNILKPASHASISSHPRIYRTVSNLHSISQ